MKNTTPNCCIVDTNVPLVANRKSDMTARCVNACAVALQEIIRDGHLVLDDKWKILSEYKNKLSPSGQPGVGDAFLKWVLTNHSNPTRCTCVAITPKPDDPLDYHEFPQHPELKKFDRSDRKFVAVCIAHALHPPILQAADSKWWGWKDALDECGVPVLFLCPEEIAKTHKKKARIR